MANANAAYIVHACNAYPKLIEALHALASRHDDNDHKARLDLINSVLSDIGEDA